MTKARDISKLLSTANGKIAGASLDVSFENISDSGTAGTKVASGTTGQRGSTAGQIRFNTTTGLAEYYTGTEFKVIDSPPLVTVVSPLEVESDVGGNVTFTITGSNFQAGAVAKFVGNDGTEITASTTTVTNSTTISAVIARSSFVNAKEPYDVKVINSSGLLGVLDNQIAVDVSPAWSTASGTLATISDEATGTHATVSATDTDGDTVSYSETGGTVLTTAGLTLNSSTGTISGNPTDVGSATTYSFNLRASAGGINVDRAFNIIVNPSYRLPTAYQSFVDARTSGTKYYISSSIGSDTNNGLTKSTPFQTLQKFASVCVSNDTAILAPETFLMSGNPYNFSGGAHALISSHANSNDFGNGGSQKANVWFVGYPNKTKVAYYGSTPSNIRDFPFIALSASSGVMGCVLERTLLGGEDNFVQTYEYSMFRGNTTAFGGGSSTRATILNCVLKNGNPAPVLNPNGVQGINAWSWSYDNDRNKYFALTNSTIYNTGGSWTASYEGADGAISVTDTIVSGTYGTDAKISQTGLGLEGSVTLNTTNWFRNSQSATVADTNSRGVYSGTYSWHLASYPSSAFNGNW
jgi:hypothetical protein